MLLAKQEQREQTALDSSEMNSVHQPVLITYPYRFPLPLTGSQGKQLFWLGGRLQIGGGNNVPNLA